MFKKYIQAFPSKRLRSRTRMPGMREDAEDENDPTWRRLAWVTELEREKRRPRPSWKKYAAGYDEKLPFFQRDS